MEIQVTGTDVRKLDLLPGFHPGGKGQLLQSICALCSLSPEKMRAGESETELRSISGRNTQNSCSMLCFCLVGEYDPTGDLQAKSNLWDTFAQVTSFSLEEMFPPCVLP